VVYPLPKGVSKLVFGDCPVDPSQLVLKLSWDNESPAISDPSSNREKNMLVRKEQREWLIILRSSPPFELLG
jgi:hypothetical protein